MLDAYIIERIRREKEAERERGGLIPLNIRVPQHTPETLDERDKDEERGSEVVDYRL
jgi:hypothetical protein